MNKVFLIGRLTKDPTTQPKKDGKGNYTKFSIAVNRFPEKTDFFDCVAFNSTGDAIILYTKKGAKIAISGRIQMDKYTATDGTTRVQAHIVCGVKTFHCLFILCGDVVYFRSAFIVIHGKVNFDGSAFCCLAVFTAFHDHYFVVFSEVVIVDKAIYSLKPCLLKKLKF